MRDLSTNINSKDDGKTALLYRDKRFTYHELKRKINERCNELKSFIKKGDRVIITLPNSPDFIINAYATGKIGGIVVPVLPLLKSKEMQEIINDVQGAVHTIQKRSQGLIHFVESYRKLTRIPRPNFQIFSLSSLFDRIQQLIMTQISGKKIDFHVTIEPETLELTADPELIEQVLLNLLMNAIFAVKGKNNAKIELHLILITAVR